LALKVNKTVLIIIKIVVSSVLLYIVFRKTGLGEVAAALREVSVPAFLSAIALYLFAQFISTIRWKLLLPEGIGLMKLLSLCMIGSFFNTFLPGVIGGDAVKGLYLYRLTGKGSLSLASIFMDRYIGFAALIAICIVAFPFGFRFFAGSPVTWLLPIIVFSFIGASLLIFGLRLGQRIGALSEFYSYFHAYKNQTTVIGKTFSLSLIVQLAGILSVYILSRGMGQQIPFLAFLLFIPLIVLFTMIPLSISGLGIRESAFVLFFGLVGVQPGAATALSLLWFITVSFASLLGLVEYIKYKREE
jgi:glycosyltransferase 2 family protein